jgi:hypothetical protein
MSEQLLTVSELQSVEIALLPDAEASKQQLLAESQGVVSIDDAFDAECAADVLAKLSTAIKQMEDARKTVKAPVLDLGRRIDGLAKGWLDGIEDEKKRISRVLGDYQLAERRKREQAEREAQEAARKAFEEAQKAEQPAEAMQAVIEQVNQQVADSSHKIAGTSVRENWKFEVVDINALFKAMPHLCKIEPNNSLIRSTIAYNKSIPGVKVWSEAVSSAR